MLMINKNAERKGGTAAVYPGFSAVANCPAAIKVGDGSKNSDQLLLNEYKILQTLDPLPFVPRVYEFTRAVFPKSAGRLNAFMLKEEWLHGVSLDAVARRHGYLPEPFVRALALVVCGYGAQLHERGILHRDLHLGNVFLCADGRVKLVDFGLACPAGKADSMAVVNGVQPPEVMNSAPCWTPAADVYMLAAALGTIVQGCNSPDCECESPEFEAWLQACTEYIPRRRPKDFSEAWEILKDVIPPVDFVSFVEQCKAYAKEALQEEAAARAC